MKHRIANYKRILLGISLLLAISFHQIQSDLHPSNTQSALSNAPQTTLARNTQLRYISSVQDDDATLASKLDSSGVSLHPGTSYDKRSAPTERSLTHCKALVYKALKSLPTAHQSALKDLTLYFTDEGTRGLAGGGTMILRCQNVTDYELTSVFVHEMAHEIDTGAFHFISWDAYGKVKKGTTFLDFISGYASYDPYEDFAESYLYYVLHGSQFRELAKTNLILSQKYEFLKKNLFDNQEFENDIDTVVMNKRAFDATLLAFKLKNFWNEQEWN